MDETIRIGTKLVLLLALALAATALASASANAQDVSATITPTGSYDGTENGLVDLVSNGEAAITCETSNFSATVNAGAENLTLDVLTFGACTAGVGGSCSVTVTTLPAPITANKDTATGGPSGTVARWTIDNNNTEAATITCGGGVVHCDVSVNTTLQGLLDASDDGAFGGTLDIDHEFVDIDDFTSIACGTAAVLTASWTIDTANGNSPPNYTVWQ